jgi:hypothetical protein
MGNIYIGLQKNKLLERKGKKKEKNVLTVNKNFFRELFGKLITSAPFICLDLSFTCKIACLEKMNNNMFIMSNIKII